MSYITNTFDEKIIELLDCGAVGFMPSDTVYGLSAKALNQAAIDKLHEIKLRDQGKPFIVLISDLTQLDELGVDITAGKQLMDKYWPGPLTIVLPAPNTPRWLTKGLDSLAVRFPDDKKLIEAISQVGPIASTSANESGQPAVTDIAQAKRVFGERLDFYVDAGNLPTTQPSTIIKPTSSGLQILRQGAVKL